MPLRSRIRDIIQELQEVCSSNNEIHFQYIENYYNNAENNVESSNMRSSAPNNRTDEDIMDNVADITVSLFDTSAESNNNNTTTQVNSATTSSISQQNVPDNTTNIASNTQSQTRTIPINITDTSNLSSTIASSIDSILSDLPNINGSELSVGANIFRVENLVPLQNQTRVQNGLTISELNEKTIIYTNPTIQENEKCHICNELFTENCIFRKNIKCEHYFHQGCIDTWYAENHKCPICNQNVRD